MLLVFGVTVMNGPLSSPARRRARPDPRPGRSLGHVKGDPLTVTRPDAPASGAIEPATELTPAAQLKITEERIIGLTATGTVPPADARYLITTFGITASVATTTVGAVVARADPYIAIAALILGLLASVLIAACAFRRRVDRV